MYAKYVDTHVNKKFLFIKSKKSFEYCPRRILHCVLKN